MSIGYAVIGRSISHSLSPALHGMIGGYSYGILDIGENELADVLGDSGYHGFNVTSPYKRAVIPYLRGISPEAERLGAVNTIVRRADGLYGYNTDVYGFQALVREEAPGAKVLVLGSGGAASAAVEGLRQLSAGEIIVVSRNPAACSVAGDRCCSYEALAEHLDADLLVNATPAGMYPANDRSPLDQAAVSIRDFRNLRAVVDLIYNPYRTKLLLDAEDAGVPARSGLEMLVRQGIEASRIFGEFDGSREDEDRIAQEALSELLLKQLNVTVIGMPGCGKSSISRRLARLMDRPFLDLDREIEQSTGRKPAEIIESDGEEAFRMIETDVLGQCCRRSGLVIATGGGAVIRTENRRLMRENSIVFYIRRPTELLSGKGRPLTGRHGAETLYRQRAAFYEEAQDLTILNGSRFGSSRRKDGTHNTYQYDLNRFAERMKEMLEEFIYENSCH